VIVQKNDLIKSIGAIFKISCGLVIGGFIAFFFIFDLMFSCGWLMGSAFCMFYLFLLAVIVRKLFENGPNDNTMLRFGMMFIGKTGLLLLILGITIYFLNKISFSILYGFIAGLFMLPVSIFLFTIYNGFKKGKENYD